MGAKISRLLGKDPALVAFGINKAFSSGLALIKFRTINSLLIAADGQSLR